MNIEDLDDDEFEALYATLTKAARQSFLSFLHFLWPQNDDQPYVIGELHEHLATLIDDVFYGRRAPRQATSVPPQHGKSRLMAVRAVAWVLAKKPGIHIALTGFSHSLLEDFLSEVVEIMAMPAYKEVFPDLHVLRGKNKAAAKTWSNGSCVQVKSQGKKLTGRRVDWLVIDDAHAGRAEAESPTLRKKVVQWYFADCLTRLSKSAKVFIIGTRWHPQDLIGHLTSEEYLQGITDVGNAERERYEVTNIKAICDDQENDPLGRKVGEPAFPQERPLDMMLSLKGSLPSYEWDSQFMGTPRSAVGNQVDVAKLRYAMPEEVPWDSLVPTRGWDLALSENQTSDYTAGALCAKHMDTGDLWIIDMFHHRMAWAKLKNNMINTSLNDKQTRGIHNIGIEGVSGFKAVFDEIQLALLGEVHCTLRNPPRGGKLVRAQPWLNKVEAGKVVVVRGSWNKAFVDELEQFPSGAHDDQIDAVSIAYEQLFSGDVLLIA